MPPSTVGYVVVVVGAVVLIGLLVQRYRLRNQRIAHIQGLVDEIKRKPREDERQG